MRKKLYLSPTNRKISGVCGGIGEYFDVDPTVVRVVWILVTMITGGLGGIVAYLLAMIIIPEKTNVE